VGLALNYTSPSDKSLPQPVKELKAQTTNAEAAAVSTERDASDLLKHMSMNVGGDNRRSSFLMLQTL